eukprot:COSAG01_NODE_524_length_15931_cov_72.340491_8_plen_146_part_00
MHACTAPTSRRPARPRDLPPPAHRHRHRHRDDTQTPPHAQLRLLSRSLHVCKQLSERRRRRRCAAAATQELRLDASVSECERRTSHRAATSATAVPVPVPVPVQVGRAAQLGPTHANATPAALLPLPLYFGRFGGLRPPVCTCAI